MALNSYYKSELWEMVKPDFYVLSDPAHKKDLEDPSSDLRKKMDEVSENIIVFVPSSWKNTKNIPLKTVFFNDNSLYGISKNILPNWPRGYISLTAYKALAIACYISRKKIGVIGFDNTEYQSISCNLQNRLILKPGSARHFFPQVSSEVDITSHYSSGMSDFFYVASMHFASLKNFPTDRIRNLDINSLTDAFEKDTIENFINLYGV